MALGNLIKRAARNLGFEITRYAPARSSAAQFQGLFQGLGTDLILDVGANTGQYARMVRGCGYLGRIISFEPLAAAHAALLRAAQGDSSWEVAERVALGAEERRVTINVSANSQSSSILDMNPEHLAAAPQSRYVATEEVRQARLDTIAAPLVAAASSVFLKIDTQGYEAEVLKGSTAILPRVSAIQLELSLVAMYQGEWPLTRMLAYMADLGYELVAMWPAFVDPHSYRTLQVDGVFARAHAHTHPATDR